MCATLGIPAATGGLLPGFIVQVHEDIHFSGYTTSHQRWYMLYKEYTVQVLTDFAHLTALNSADMPISW